MFRSVTPRAAIRPPAEPPAPLRPGELSLLAKDALADDRVQLHVQSVTTEGGARSMAHHEAFLRILDPAGRVIPAGRFMSAVEKSAIGRDLDCAALRLGMQALRVHPRLTLAVNASAQSIGNPAWRRILEDSLDELGGRLILEIGEGSATLVPDRVIRFMAEVRPRGLRMILDDFGTGPLSLRDLRDFGFDGVKIDRTFIHGIDRSPPNEALVDALVTVAHRFGLHAIAKGVETEAEAALLRRLGLDGLQGYLFGHPGPIS